MTTPTYLNFAGFIAELERRHGLSPVKRATTIARIQQFQKLGMSKGSGRGRKALYDEEDVERMSVMLALIDSGVSPAFALKRVNGHQSKALDYLR